MQNIPFVISRLFRLTFFIIFCMIYQASLSFSQTSLRLHSHNDYDQTYPLNTALTNKCSSIEVDIIWSNNRLVVTHDTVQLDKKPTLEELYLKPLSLRPPSELQDLWLLIDIKVYNKATLDALHETLSKYPNLFKENDGSSQSGVIKALLSGEIPRDEILKNHFYKYFFIDGRMTDLPFGYDHYKVPMISANIVDFVGEDHSTQLSPSTISSIMNAIDNCHKQGKAVRFWNTPDTPEVWDQLIKMGVDVIGVDNPSAFLQYIE